jgi:FkbM family methyltransferase
MTPELVTRSFSNDQEVFNRTFFENIYKLKGEKDSNSIFVDIGSHAGYFAFAALNLGAAKVYAFEPFVDNYQIFLKNCYNYNYAGRVTPYQLGVSLQRKSSKFSIPKLIDNIYFDTSSINILNESEEEENYYPCQCETLDEILNIYCFNETIDVLKINIGYLEKEILSSSLLLQKNVISFCAEIDASNDEFLKFKKETVLKGFHNSFSEEINEDRKRIWFSKEKLSKHFNI